LPELPEVESVRRRLEPVMTGSRIVDVELRRPDLRAPFPPRFKDRLIGQTIRSVNRRAKYLVLELSSGEVLIMHLGMSGAFYVDPSSTASDDEPRLPLHDHVVFHLEPAAVVTFNDPRRFGFMDLLTGPDAGVHPVLSGLGPEPLSGEFDAAALARACRGKKTSIKVALLDQRVVAGIGNIYASEALHLAGLSPRRRAGSIATRSGAPRQTAVRLAAAIKKVLADAVQRISTRGYRGSRFRVYEREGERCRRRGCPGVIRRLTQAGRSTFFCPVCQR
jgi:formamidopyrimidine-DNA glycosylase